MGKRLNVSGQKEIGIVILCVMLSSSYIVGYVGCEEKIFYVGGFSK